MIVKYRKRFLKELAKIPSETRLKIEKEKAVFERALHRRDIYRFFP